MGVFIAKKSTILMAIVVLLRFHAGTLPLDTIPFVSSLISTGYCNTFESKRHASESTNITIALLVRTSHGLSIGAQSATLKVLPKILY
jgi:hypothetical protein